MAPCQDPLIIGTFEELSTVIRWSSCITIITWRAQATRVMFTWKNQLSVVWSIERQVTKLPIWEICFIPGVHMLVRVNWENKCFNYSFHSLTSWVPLPSNGPVTQGMMGWRWQNPQSVTYCWQTPTGRNTTGSFRQCFMAKMVVNWPLPSHCYLILQF